MNASPSIAVFAPAKLNLFLAVTGRRADGFHDLVSLVAPVDFGDTLRLTEAAEAPCDELHCDAPSVPTDGANLILRAAAAWRAAGGEAPFVRFELEKWIPVGAGLGGGSSDAVAALRALQRLARRPLPAEALHEIAAQLGSDCPLFLADAPVIMRGRGEQLSPLDSESRARLTGQLVLLCKPSFAIETRWAYAQLAARAPKDYLDAAEAEHRLSQWQAGKSALAELAWNSFAEIAFEKFAALPVLAQRLRKRCGLNLQLTGSGSACFALLPPAGTRGDPTAEILDAWGPEALVRRVHLA